MGMTQTQQYTSLLARFAPSNPTRKLAEQYRAQGYDLATIIDYIEPIVIEMDKDLAALGA